MPEYVACSLYLNGAIQVKDEYSLVIYCKCLNEEIKVLCGLKFSQKNFFILLLQLWVTIDC